MHGRLMTLPRKEDFMPDIYRLLVMLHIAAGTVALASYWSAALARKGSTLHVRSGKVFWKAMVVICATAVPMSVFFFRRGQPGTGTFLAYLVIITASAMWVGLRAIRLKQDQAAFRGGQYGAVAVANLLAGLAVLATGVYSGNALSMGFSMIGIVVGVNMLRKRSKPSASRNWWVPEHFGAMLGCGVATHVAFLAIGLDRLVALAGWHMPPDFKLVAWAAPVVVALAAGVWLDRKYNRRPAAAARQQRSA
jgi:uncharacterized membrane protein YfcA